MWEVFAPAAALFRAPRPSLEAAPRNGAGTFFTQDHQPGERLQLDWMHCEKLEIELVQEERFDHLLVHVVLPYSNWEWARVCYSESYLSLKSGLQSALVELGACPRYCQSDQSSTATHVRGGGSRRSGREYNARYLGLLAHYD